MPKIIRIILCLLFLTVITACTNTPDVHLQEPLQAIQLAPSYYAVDSGIPQHNEIHVSLEIDPSTRTVQGLSRINFTNNTGQELDTIVMRVFCYDFAPLGYMNIEYASANNVELDFAVYGTVLTLYLPETLVPENTVHLRLRYSAYVPIYGGGTGGTEDVMWFGMFLPMLSVFDNGDWLTCNFYPIGAPFFLETANHTVDITTPLDYTEVGTGLRNEEIIYDADVKITRFSANMTRDFAFAVLSPVFYHGSTTTTSGVEINFHYHSQLVHDRADYILDFSRDVIEHFEAYVGVYAFGQVTIVEADLHERDSLAFSQFVLADTRELRHGSLQELAHSLGSQWFVSVVGTNRITEPWLGAGLTRFVQAINEHYPAEFLHTYMAAVRNVVDEIPLSKGLPELENWAQFDSQQYMAMLMLYDLRQLMGDEYFWQLINRYYQKFSFRIATAADFFALAEEVSGLELSEFYYEWAY